MQPGVAQSLLCKHRRPWPWGSPSSASLVVRRGVGAMLTKNSFSFYSKFKPMRADDILEFFQTTPKQSEGKN